MRLSITRDTKTVILHNCVEKHVQGLVDRGEQVRAIASSIRSER